MAYRKNAKPDVEEVPMREPIQWHRRWLTGLSLAWAALAVLGDAGAFRHYPVSLAAVSVWCGVATVVVCIWNLNRVEKGRW
jgi:hypothetical protein